MTPSTSTPKIVATAQQSRFDSALTDPTSISELELFTVNIAIDQLEILVDTEIRFKDGIKYALVGPNGSGKSTILRAIADRLFAGTPESLRIVLIDQNAGLGEIENTQAETVLQHVVNGHRERARALRELDLLSRAVSSAAGFGEYQQVVLSRATAELELRRRNATRRSGARGKEARAEEIKAEEALKAAEEGWGSAILRLTSRLHGPPTDGWEMTANEMLLDVQMTLELLGSDTLEQEARRILRGLGFSSSRIEGPVKVLSGGWKSRMALAVGLLVPSDLLLLDEPSNFMDLETLKFLELRLSELDQTLVITSHDQAFLDNIAERTVVLRRKKLLYFEGTPSSMQDAEMKKRLNRIKTQAALDKKKEHVQQGIIDSRRRAKASGDDKRMKTVVSKQKKLDERWGDERSANGFRFKLNRDFAGYHTSNRAEVVIEEPDPPVVLKLPSPPAMRTKGSLVHLDNLCVKFKGASKQLFADVNVTVEQGGRCAFVGKNGQGKTTLARLIVGDIVPSIGSVIRHPTMKMEYYTQHSADKLTESGEDTPLAWFMAKVGQVSEGEARSFLGSWGLHGQNASRTLISALSGGQKVRLALAALVFTPPDLLVLDEVTTHLDAGTIRALAIALRSFSGAIILITHDRWFSKVVVEGMEIEEGDEAAPTGQTFLVEKGTVRLVAGMKKRAKRL
ncbi:P-loop containing nucleoside triphosphate hydrolase protein [Kockovaella imperatae]|uniref:p-loop containing nucleoside triphosphate hydrolase protein n=1 Tax=Kockovaella imperatae TaxID=4999 RepID=A0A1Y1UL64_9TREE|nr:P-loop containing nucleoside triphosphate hydrolase protein [Kockovaella imperatae]ORX38729.1 P-loop containing nucleoside triphosphate hydrolase protein [Kockovaella imperatae]